MDIGKYKQAMRPKKYLDGKFVIYDETMPDASDEQLGARENFKDGGAPDTSPVKTSIYKYPKSNRFGTVYTKTPGTNQYGALTRSLEEVQKIIDEAPKIKKKGKLVEMTRKDLEGRSEYNNINRGGKRYVTRKEFDKYAKDLIFKTKGKPVLEDPSKGSITRRAKIKPAQGSEISIKGGKELGKNFGHVYPIIEDAPPGTKTTNVINADMNNKLIGYNIIGQDIAEKQQDLIRNKPPGYEKEIVALNAKAKKNVMNAVKDLGKEYKGNIGYFQVDPDTGEFKPKAGNYKMSFAGIEGENKIYKDMTPKERKNFEKKISAIEKAKTIPGVTTADKIQRPDSSTTREMFERFNKLRGVLIPGLEEIKEGLKTLPDDFAKKRYFTAGLKSLGIVATPLIISGMYNDLKGGKTVMETLERNLIGTDAIGGIKDIFALTPEERQARSIIKQSEMDEQIAQDFSGLDVDLQTPRVESKMSLEEALKEYEEGLKRVELEREQEEAERAEGRASSFEGLKDLITGERFQPQPIPRDFLAEGGPPDDPSKRKFLKIMGALSTIPILGKYIGLAKPVAKSAPAVVEAAKGVPPYFFKLVDKIKTMGDDVTKRSATTEREVVTEYKDYRLTEDVATGEKTIQRLKTDSDFDYYDENLAEETYMNYKPGKGQSDEATGPVADEYVEDTSYIRTSGPQKGDIYDTVDGVPDDVIEEGTMFEDNMTEFGKTKKKLGIK